MDEREGRAGTESGRGQEHEFQIQDKAVNLGSTIPYIRVRDFGQSFNLSKGQLFPL